MLIEKYADLIRNDSALEFVYFLESFHPEMISIERLQGHSNLESYFSDSASMN